jgi:hypothetical protein
MGVLLWMGKGRLHIRRTIMEGRRELLEEKLSRLLSEVAQMEVELSREEGAIVGMPHYSVIESRAHQLGRRLSRQVQQQRMAESTATAALGTGSSGSGTSATTYLSWTSSTR